MKQRFPHWEQNLGIAIVVIWCVVLSICLLRHNDVKEEKPEPEVVIGEYYGEQYFFGHSYGWGWAKFTQKQIQDEVDGFIKIGGRWVEKGNVFHYTDIDIYDPLRKGIERRNENVVAVIKAGKGFNILRVEKEKEQVTFMDITEEKQ